MQVHTRIGSIGRVLRAVTEHATILLLSNLDVLEPALG